jgi:hypothetical protein
MKPTTARRRRLGTPESIEAAKRTLAADPSGVKTITRVSHEPRMLRDILPEVMHDLRIRSQKMRSRGDVISLKSRRDTRRSA